MELDYHLQLSKSGSRQNLLIVFSDFLPTNPGPGKFAFRHIFNNWDGNFLYVRDVGNHWYNRGLHGLGGSVPETAHKLKELVDAHGFESVNTFGASMGGYAAILYGRILKARKVVATSPQTFLASPYPRFNPSYHAGDYQDLSCSSLEAVREEILVSVDELFDLYSALRMKLGVRRGQASGRIAIIPLLGCSHLIPRAFLNAGVLDLFLRQVACGEDLMTVVGSFVKDGDIESAFNKLAEVVESFYGGQYEAALSALEHLAMDNPDWAGVHFFRGEVYKMLGAQGAKIECYSRAVDLNPALFQASLELARYYLAAKDYPQALRHVASAYKANISYKKVVFPLLKAMLVAGVESSEIAEAMRGVGFPELELGELLEIGR